MIDFCTFILFCFGILTYVISVPYFKSFLNPLGVYSLIWGVIPFLYGLRLSSVLQELSMGTYVALFVSYFSFILGSLFLVKKSDYYLSKFDYSNLIISRSKAYKIYFIMLFFAIVEMFIKTPPLFSSNPFGAYMSGVGVRILHFSIILVSLPYFVLLLDKSVALRIKILLFFPPLFLPLIYMQRGLAISFLIGFATVLLSKMPLKKQLVIVSVGVFFVLQLVVIAGNFRQSYNTGSSSISSVSGMNEDIPELVMWLYTYTTPSVQNLNQTINNESVVFRYGFDLVDPLLSLSQMKFFSQYLFPNYEQPFDVISGFNVPTYLNWAYLNWGFIGFIIVPFFIGFIAQLFFNGIVKGSLFLLLCFAIWLPNIVYSFHDFLFWNPSMLLNFIFIFTLSYKLKLNEYFSRLNSNT